MKTDNYIKVILTSIVILLGIIVVKDIDLPPKAHADILGNDQIYQVECIALHVGREPSSFYILNSQTGIVKMLTYKNIKDFKSEGKSMIQKYGEKPDF
jgi:hypothetical protein